MLVSAAYAVRSTQLLVMGSVYDLKTGKVEVIDEASIRLGGGLGARELTPGPEPTRQYGRTELALTPGDQE